jgi:uncharacterized C2H2 Zn-finger protein
MPPSEREDTIQSSGGIAPDPVQAAIEAQSKDPLTPDLVCPWCGSKLQSEKSFKSHVIKQHGKNIGESAQRVRDGDVSVTPLPGHVGAKGGAV